MKLDLVELEDSIRGIKKIFVVVEINEEKKANTKTFYLASEVDFRWSTIKDKL